jgi:hypothetical protein
VIFAHLLFEMGQNSAVFAGMCQGLLVSSRLGQNCTCFGTAIDVVVVAVDSRSCTFRILRSFDQKGEELPVDLNPSCD